MEHADCVGVLDHLECLGIVGRDGVHAERDVLASVLFEQIEGAAHAAEHAEAEDIDLHEAQDVDIVLIPLDDLTVLHGGGFDGDKLVQSVLREDETAGMLGEVAGKPDQFPRQIEREPQARVVQIKIQLCRVVVFHAVVGPRPDL